MSEVGTERRRAPAASLGNPDLQKQRQLGTVESTITHALRTNYDYSLCRTELLFPTSREHRPPYAPWHQDNCVSHESLTSTFTQQRLTRLRSFSISCWLHLVVRYDLKTQHHHSDTTHSHTGNKTAPRRLHDALGQRYMKAPSRRHLLMYRII